MKFTDEQVHEAIKAVVEERGADFIYPDEWKYTNDCLYVRPDGDGPACIVGAVLHHLGVPLSLLSANEGRPAYALVHYLGGVSPRAGDALAWAQGVQDTGKTWGEALASFEEHLFAVMVP